MTEKSPNPAKLHSLADLHIFLVPRACDVTMAAAEVKARYSAIVLGATGNVGGRIVQLLIKNPLCKKVVVVTPQDGRLRRPQGLRDGCQHGPARRGGRALRPGS